MDSEEFGCVDLLVVGGLLFMAACYTDWIGLFYAGGALFYVIVVKVLNIYSKDIYKKSGKGKK